MRGDESSKLCPDLHIFSVPEKNGKADLTRYRDASAEVFNAITQFIAELEENAESNSSIILERASVDEAYLDFTNYISTRPLVLPDFNDLETCNTKLLLGDTTLDCWLAQMKAIGNFNKHHLQLILGAVLVGKMRQYILGNYRIADILTL